MGHAPPRSRHKPETHLQRAQRHFIADRITVEDFEALVGDLIASGVADETAPVLIAPPPRPRRSIGKPARY